MLWLLDWLCYQRGVSNITGFLTGNELQSNMRQSASLIWFELANLYSMLHACTNKWKSACQNRHNGLRASKDIYLAPRLKTFFMLKQLRMELLLRLKCWKIDFSCFQTLFNEHDNFMLRWVKHKMIYILVASMSSILRFCTLCATCS